MANDEEVVTTRRNFAYRERDKILRFIDWFWEEMGHAPSLRDIGHAIGIRSSSTVYSVVNTLENQGYIQRVGRNKAIKVVPGSAAYCPHLWRVANPEDEILDITCQHCGRRTQVEYVADPTDLTTWLIFDGEA